MYTAVKNTSYKAVIPFYVYAAIAFLTATFFLFLWSDEMKGHYFNPRILTITHCMVLGWATMVIMGASYQLLPVITEKNLKSESLALWSFITLAIGVPLLLLGFYRFDMGLISRSGGILVNISVLLYLVNITGSISNTQDSVHVVFILTAALYLFLTTLIGLALIFNFTQQIFSNNSLHYLSLHAHTGIAGWFLMLIMGVGSRLIPMFMVSKYTNTKLLWLIYLLMNTGLISFIVLYIFFHHLSFTLPLALIILSISLFIYYCFQCYRQRVRNNTDNPMKVSLMAILMVLMPVIPAVMLASGEPGEIHENRMMILYGFIIIFGWLTAIILGMTFKTLPFIVWNKIYGKSGTGDAVLPKDLFDNRIFNLMAVFFFTGIIIFIAAIIIQEEMVFKISAATLLLSAILYDWNVVKIIFHKSAITNDHK